jgi:hypothetical protein
LGYQHSLKHRLLNKMADMKQACKLLRERT